MTVRQVLCTCALALYQQLQQRENGCWHFGSGKGERGARLRQWSSGVVIEESGTANILFVVPCSKMNGNVAKQNGSVIAGNPYAPSNVARA